eukprot:768667-Hanusia_phi.AAC.5
MKASIIVFCLFVVDFVITSDYLEVNSTEILPSNAPWSSFQPLVFTFFGQNLDASPFFLIRGTPCRATTWLNETTVSCLQARPYDSISFPPSDRMLVQERCFRSQLAETENSGTGNCRLRWAIFASSRLASTHRSERRMAGQRAQLVG